MGYHLQSGYRFAIPYLYSLRCKSKQVEQSVAEFFMKEWPYPNTVGLNDDLLEGRVMCNGKPVGLYDKVKQDDLITRFMHWHEPEVLASSIDILHVSDDIVVVNKPPSIPVHPTGDFRKNSILRILLSTSSDLLEGGKVLHMVHRLDRLASGLLIFARSSSTGAKFNKQLSKRTVLKEYLARVKGTFPPGVVEVSKSINRVQKYPIKYGVCDSGDGKPALTVFERESISPDGSESVVRCRPMTGRTHQIRVHLSSLGYPITNDFKYGGSLELSRGPEPVPEFLDYPRLSWCPTCRAGGKRETSHVAPEDLLPTHMWLHALSYRSTDSQCPWEFTTPRPEWSQFNDTLTSVELNKSTESA